MSAMELTREVLWRHVAEPEPSTEGTWFVLPLEYLQAQGWTYIEIHVSDGEEHPNMVRLIKEDAESND